MRKARHDMASQGLDRTLVQVNNCISKSRYSTKQVFLNISKNSQANVVAGVSLKESCRPSAGAGIP